MGRVSAEMVRPTVTAQNFGGYDVDMLRIASLARMIQIRCGYLHSCSPTYCLKDRATCRFFFPWPRQPYQCYCENTGRVALQRRLPEDDMWVVPHNIYIVMFSQSSVNVIAFDPFHGADQARHNLLNTAVCFFHR